MRIRHPIVDPSASTPQRVNGLRFGSGETKHVIKIHIYLDHIKFSIIDHRYSDVLHLPFDLFEVRHLRSQTAPNYALPALPMPWPAGCLVPFLLPFQEWH